MLQQYPIYKSYTSHRVKVLWVVSFKFFFYFYLIVTLRHMELRNLANYSKLKINQN
jgi:hypothetical protein